MATYTLRKAVFFSGIIILIAYEAFRIFIEVNYGIAEGFALLWVGRLIASALLLVVSIYGLSLIKSKSINRLILYPLLVLYVYFAINFLYTVWRQYSKVIYLTNVEKVEINENHQKSVGEINLDKLFHNSKGDPIVVNGRKLVRLDRFKMTSEVMKLKFTFLSTNSNLKQGFILETDGILNLIMVLLSLFDLFFGKTQHLNLLRLL